MRALIQKVRSASVSVEGIKIAEIKFGLLVFLGIESIDQELDHAWLSHKIVNLRIFEDENKIMNRSVKELGGEILLVSQFTLHASTKKGNRPSYIRAASPDKALPLYASFQKELEKELGAKIKCGKFGAMMEVDLVNDGPMTILIDTQNKE